MNLAPDLDSLAALRGTVYRLLLLALDKPSPDQHRQLREPSFRTSLGLLCDQFGSPMPPGELVPESYDDYESRYLATFEVGLPEAPVVLLASHHIRHEPAPRVVHEHVLFYRYFDARPGEETGEAPDHLLNELRFLIHLDRLQECGGSSRESLTRARRDFLDRQFLRWIPGVAELATARGISPTYQVVLQLLAAVAREDRALLDAEGVVDSPGSRP